jgi:hypothetical protein
VVVDCTASVVRHHGTAYDALATHDDYADLAMHPAYGVLGGILVRLSCRWMEVVHTGLQCATAFDNRTGMSQCLASRHFTDGVNRNIKAILC